jgi:hypothetical protein
MAATCASMHRAETTPRRRGTAAPAPPLAKHSSPIGKTYGCEHRQNNRTNGRKVYELVNEQFANLTGELTPLVALKAFLFWNERSERARYRAQRIGFSTGPQRLADGQHPAIQFWRKRLRWVRIIAPRRGRAPIEEFFRAVAKKLHGMKLVVPEPCQTRNAERRFWVYAAGLDFHQFSEVYVEIPFTRCGQRDVLALATASWLIARD